MMRSALSGQLLCESCSDPIYPEELTLSEGEPFHEDCAPQPARQLQEISA